MDATYILPLRRDHPQQPDRLTSYLRALARRTEVIVVDGSPADVFAAHADEWGAYVRHLPPDPDLRRANGKVENVLTGVRHARHERLVIADEDVRYDAASLVRVVELLGEAQIVRPQNYFDPLPWHARWDTARTLLNRVTGGDWPGTLGVRRSVLEATNGYDGDVLFENLELVRTVRAAGGRELTPLGLFVRRLPPDGRHFWSQRVRQAYDEFARPHRLGVSLAVLPLVALLGYRRRWRGLAIGIVAAIGLAECGRRRGGGRMVFPATASLLAPLWLVERGVCAWLAVGMRLLHGGVPYHGSVLRRAATPMAVLKRRHRAARPLVLGPATVEAPGRVGRDAPSPRSAGGQEVAYVT